MKEISAFELPQSLQPAFKAARKLEWITIAYLLTVIVIMYLAMGTSQAMKTAWLEDVLSLMPAIAFLVASAVYDRKPTRRFPYGYHRAFGIAALAGAVALFGMGSFLLVDSALSLIRAEHPTIGSVQIFGYQLWSGWVMMLALVYSVVPAMILGYKKLPLARKLNNRLLHTDADTQKADYLTALAAMLGILGIGLGFWWADAVAAIFISLSTLKDGAVNLKSATGDLMDRCPTKIGSDENAPLVDDVGQLVESWEWVNEASVRFRESGQVCIGEVLVTLNSEGDIAGKIEEGIALLRQANWKIQDVVIVPVKRLPEQHGS